MTHQHLPLVQCPAHSSHGRSQAMLDDPPVCSPMVQHPCSADFHSASTESECSLARSFWHPDLSIGPLGPAPLCTTMATASQAMLDDPLALALGPAPPCTPKDMMTWRLNPYHNQTKP